MDSYLGKCGVMVPPKCDQVTASAWEFITLLAVMVLLTALLWYSKWLGLLLCYVKCGARLQPICVASHCMGSDYHAFLWLSGLTAMVQYPTCVGSLWKVVQIEHWHLPNMCRDFAKYEYRWSTNIYPTCVTCTTGGAGGILWRDGAANFCSNSLHGQWLPCILRRLVLTALVQYQKLLGLLLCVTHWCYVASQCTWHVSGFEHRCYVASQCTWHVSGFGHWHLWRNPMYLT